MTEDDIVNFVFFDSTPEPGDILAEIFALETELDADFVLIFFSECLDAVAVILECTLRHSHIGDEIRVESPGGVVSKADFIEACLNSRKDIFFVSASCMEASACVCMIVVFHKIRPFFKGIIRCRP